MQINQTSQLSQLNKLQQILSNNTSSSNVNDSNSTFESLLEGMLQKTSSANLSNMSDSANLSGESSSNNLTKDAVSGLSSLSVDPQKLMQMMLSSQNTNSATSDFSDDSSDDDSNNDIGISGSNDETTEMVDNLLQAAMENQGTNANNNVNQASTIAKSQAI